MQKFLRRILTKPAPVFLQYSETECGIACLAMIFAYHNYHISFEKLRELCGVSRDGCKATTLMQVAEFCGFTAVAYRVEMHLLQEIVSPVIAFWNFSHYVVVNKIYANYASINDPAIGKVKIPPQEFDKAFTGIIIDIAPTKKTVNIVKKRTNSVLSSLYSMFKIELIFLVGCLLVLSFLPLLKTTINGLLIDQVIINKHLVWLFYTFILSVCLFLIFVLVSCLQKSIEFKLVTKASLLKLNQLLQHILQLPLIFFIMRQRGEIIANLCNADAIYTLLFKNCLTVFVAIVMGACCLTSMVWFNTQFAIISALITLSSLITAQIVSRLNLHKEQSLSVAQGRWYSQTFSASRNLLTIKVNFLQQSILAILLKHHVNKISVQDRVNHINLLISVNTKLHVLISGLIIMTYGCYLVSLKLLTLGNVLAFYSIHFIFMNQINQIIFSLLPIQKALVQFQRLSNIQMYQNEVNFRSQTHLSVLKLDNVYSIQHLYFLYNLQASSVLNNVSFTIGKHQHIAFVGATGSGKSTLIKLLMGFFQPTAGEIKLFGNHLHDYTNSELSELFAYVSQDVNLFSNTLLFNLTLGKEIPLYKIQQAVDIACLSTVLQKYSLITEINAFNLSGGERQRIEIARAVLQNTPILILDEATSALDISTEAQIIKNLKLLNKTIIFISHRLSTIKHCDCIYVLKNGFIIENGTHDELLSVHGEYYLLLNNEISQLQL